MAKKPRTRRAEAAPSPSDATETPEQTIERLAVANGLLGQQLNAARQLFFTLAERRGADRVRAGELDWNGGTNYVASEQQGFDAALAQVVEQMNGAQG